MKRVLVVLAAILLAFLWRVAPVLHRKMTAANEYAVLAHLKAVRQAQGKYASSSGGWFGDLECLAHPGSCQLYTSDSEPLLDASVALAELRGSYRFVFIPGTPMTREGWKVVVKRSAEYRRQTNRPPFDPDNIPARYSGYAYMAIPRYPGITGELGFCAASNGAIYSYLPDELHLLEVTFPECLKAPSQCRDFHRCGEDIFSVRINEWPHPKAAEFFPEIPAFPEFLKPYARDTILLVLAVPLCALVLWSKRKIFRP